MDNREIQTNRLKVMEVFNVTYYSGGFEAGFQKNSVFFSFTSFF